MRIVISLVFFLHAIIGISSQVLFDLNGNNADGNLDGPEVEFIEKEDYVIQNVSSYKFNDSVKWGPVHVLVIGSEGSVHWDHHMAMVDGRIPSDIEIDDIKDTAAYEETHLPSYFDDKISTGRTFTSDILNTSRFVQALFNGLVFDVYPKNFEKRLVCIAAQALNLSDNFTVGCVNITYIGTNNDNPVVIDYRELSDRIFMEGSNPIHVLGNNLTILHDDHPQFLLQKIEVQLMHPMMEYESLGFDGTGNYFEYDKISGLLTTLSDVEGTPEFFKELMLNVTYSNINPEPPNENRTIIFSVSDGSTIATELSVFILVENTNDDTVITFNEDVRLMQYFEGSGKQVIDSSLVIDDTDIDPHIENILIELNGLDDGKEFIFINASSNQIEVHVNNSESRISLSGVANLSEYTILLRSLEYLHTDAHPGNPTLGERMIDIIINDGRGVTDNEFNFTVLPVNDPPILLFFDGDIGDDIVLETGSKTHFITYAEDEPSKEIAPNIFLRDIDSQIAMASIFLENKSENDNYSFNSSLLSIYNVAMLEDDNGITLLGVAQAVVYEKILKSLSFFNKIQNDAIVEEGQKNVTIVVNDTDGAESKIVEIVITLTATDDQPEFVINDIIEFTEGSTSVDVATPEILSLMDEENDDIASISIQLYAVNGILDDDDTLVYRSKKFIPTELNRTHITYEQTTSIEESEEFLRSIRYINQADEPTYYADATSKEILRRMIQVTIIPVDGEKQNYDITVNITLVNDNKPVILSRLHDNVCNSTHPTIFSSKYSKRDTSSFTKLQRRLYNKRRVNNTPGLAPSVVVAYSNFNMHQSCMESITTKFSTGTSTPPVEVKRDLSEFVSVLPNDFSHYLSHGEWKDRSTLIIHFTGCYIHQDASLQIAFKGRGDIHCNATSRCTYADGICFKNTTGCPIIGSVSVLTNFTASVLETSSMSNTSMSFHASFMLYVGVMVAAIMTILIAWESFKHNISTLNSESKSHGEPVTEIKDFPPVQTLLPHQMRDIPSEIVCKDHEKRPPQKDMCTYEPNNSLKELVTCNNKDERTFHV